MSVVVFGSVNMDLVVEVQRLPLAGETLLGQNFFTAPGGKGANQAVAAARLGSHTRMVGRVGQDVFGTTLRDSLATDGVDIGGVEQDRSAPSGIAAIAVDAAGQNTIVVVPGANGTLDETDLVRLEDALVDARVLLLQLEIPVPLVTAAARAARRHNVTVILDPAPAQPLPPELYALVNILTPNQSEASTLTGIPVRDRETAARAAAILLEHGVRSVIVKLGADGAYWATAADAGWVPPFSVAAIDTVAAGDAFNGALATALASGRVWNEALRWAAAAGALATTKPGAQAAMPRLDELEVLLSS